MPKRKIKKRNSSNNTRELPNRNVREKIKTAKGRKISSTRWLQRQLNDQYVKEARIQGFRSRAAYKLIQINQRFNILKPGMKVIDLGAAPGGWSQVAIKAIDCEKSNSLGRLLSIDLVDIEPILGAEHFKLDFMSKTSQKIIKSSLNGKADVLLSDIAPPLSGHKKTDHIRIISVVEEVYNFAFDILEPDGSCVAKIFQGGTQSDLLDCFKRSFKTVKHVKPKSSRPDSSELFLVAQGFRDFKKSV